MKRWTVIGISAILAAVFVVTGIQQWRFASIVQDDVDYMTERIMNAPEEIPWPRQDSSFPYGVHEELGLHCQIMSIFTAANHISALALLTILSVALVRRKSRTTQSSEQ